jgi:hypothetical protein
MKRVVCRVCKQPIVVIKRHNAQVSRSVWRRKPWRFDAVHKDEVTETTDVVSKPHLGQITRTRRMLEDRCLARQEEEQRLRAELRRTESRLSSRPQ